MNDETIKNFVAKEDVTLCLNLGESYDVYDVRTVVPQLVRKGIATLKEAEDFGCKLLADGTVSKVAIVRKKHEAKVCRLMQL